MWVTWEGKGPEDAQRAGQAVRSLAPGLSPAPACPRRLPGREEETDTAGPALTVAKDETPWHRTACAHSKHAEGATPLL